MLKGTCDNTETSERRRLLLFFFFFFNLQTESDVAGLLINKQTHRQTHSPSSASVHQLQLAAGERQDAADVVGDAQGEEGDDHQQQQHPPEAQVLHKLLPGGPEAGQDALAALQVGVEEGVTLHGTGGGREGEGSEVRLRTAPAADESRCANHVSLLSSSSSFSCMCV